jgi:hypothetical protein
MDLHVGVLERNVDLLAARGEPPFADGGEGDGGNKHEQQRLHASIDSRAGEKFQGEFSLIGPYYTSGMSLRGPVLARGLVLLLASLIQLTPLALLGMGLSTLGPTLLVLLWLQTSSGAKRAFAVALVATALGALLDALTPSYDASFLWGWAGGAMTLVAELATLGGFSFLSRRVPLVILGLGTALSLSRLVVEDVLALRLAAAGLLALGHFWLVSSLPKAAPQPGPFSPEAAGGLFRWSLVELTRLIIFAIAFLVAVTTRFSDSDFQIVALVTVSLCAIAGALGYRALTRFCDGAAALGVRAQLARSLPLLGILVTLGIFPGVAESLITRRESALVRADVNAGASCILALIALWALVRAARGSAKKLARGGWALALVSWLLLLIPVSLLLSAVAESFVDWDTRRALHSLEALLLIGFVLAWIMSVVLLLVAGRKLRAHGTPGGVGDEVAHAS